ncbi:hypothetical protein QF049_001038 [Paenibacillus sp. W4I10]|uniref:hypothetical protein n=1 Tax=Paenibacillus sp. W4I10 TaxID=3042298 RepID=UPI002789A23A|nr:hypothetical protein [Paenibacillus sp. W4I10]MDQ0719777.1 hypothetical protein [Paenibacillus sp. W4I10]
MVQDFAKFMATTDKKIVFGDKDVELKLTIPHKVAQQNLQFLTSCLNKEIHVILGDPQAAFDFEDEERDAMYRTWNGHRVTTDQSGVVTKIDRPGSEPEQDENQGKMFGPDGEPIQPQGPSEDGQEDGNDEGQPVVPPTSGDDPGNDPNDPYGDDDIPNWMKDGGDDQSGPKEMDFSSGDLEGEQPPAGDTEGASDEINPDDLERYILENRPIIPDITLDVPAAIERKRGSDETWREIADSLGISQGKLSGAISRYKKAVKEQMAGSGVA